MKFKVGDRVAFRWTHSSLEETGTICEYSGKHFRDGKFHLRIDGFDYRDVHSAHKDAHSAYEGDIRLLTPLEALL